MRTAADEARNHFFLGRLWHGDKSGAFERWHALRGMEAGFGVYRWYSYRLSVVPMTRKRFSKDEKTDALNAWMRAAPPASSDLDWRSAACGGFPDYEVSEYGHVRRITPQRGTVVGKVKRPHISARGRLCYGLTPPDCSSKTVLISRLVAAVFYGPAPSAEHHAAHGDGNELNNHYTNLRWATPKENAQDKVRHGTINNGRRNGMAKFTEEIVRAVRRNPLSDTDLAAHLGMGRSTISALRNGSAWAWLQ